MKADHSAVSRRLKIARGQLDGILRMVEEDRYCIDISTQLLAVIAALKGINREVLRMHLMHCVKESLSSENMENIDRKMKEIDKIIETLSK